jgi:MFS family permease
MSFQIPPALRYRRFALFWGGQFISIAGSQMQLAALLWHLRTLSDQPILVSGIGLVRFLPILLFSPISGVIADTFNRRKILFITQTTMALTALMLGLLTWWGTIHIWQIYLLTGIQAIAISFDLPARQALMPNLLPRNLLPSAFSLQSIAQNTGSIAGPALGGMVIGYFGQQYTYLFNAVSFGAVLLALVLMGPVVQESLSGHLTFRSSWISIREGVHFITHQPIILSSMLLDFVATFFSSASTLLPFVARDILHVNEIAYGWLVSSESVGAVLVGLIMSQRTNIRRQGALLMLAVAAFGVATILLGLSTTVFMAMLALALVGASDSISTILRNTIRQLQTPDFIRGRMVSLNAIFFQGGPQLGEIESGIAAQFLGAPMAIVTGGIGCIVSVLIVAFAWPQLRKYRGDEPTLVPAD